MRLGKEQDFGSSVLTEQQRTLNAVQTEQGEKRVLMLAVAAFNQHGRDMEYCLQVLTVIRDRFSIGVLALARAALVQVHKGKPEERAIEEWANVKEEPLPAWYVQCDTGLAPAARHVTQLEAYRVYCIASQIITQEYRGRGWIEYHDLRQRLKDYQIDVTSRTFKNWIKDGLNWYWWQHDNRLYLISLPKVWAKLTDELCRRNLHSIAKSIRPQTVSYLDLRGSLQEYSAALYVAWIDSRSAVELTVSRKFLCSIWNTCANTLRRWERGRVDVQQNYAQYGGEDLSVVPHHAIPYITKDGVARFSWQIANSYQVKTSARRARYAQRRKCRRRRKQRIEYHAMDELPPDKRGGGVLSFNRRYFNQPDRVQAEKAAKRDMRKHKDWQRECQIRLGCKRTPRKTVVGLYDRFDNRADFGHTDLHERDFAREQTPEFQAWRANIMAMRAKYAA